MLGRNTCSCRVSFSIKFNPIQFTDSTGQWVETAFDILSLAMTINDIRNEGFTVMNTISLVTDVAAVVLPVVPAGVSQALRAAKYASKAVNAMDTAADAKKLVSNADEVVKIVKKAPIVIGENADRVKDYAKMHGADYYKQWKFKPYVAELHETISKARNQRWINDMMKEGREIIDIGPDFARRTKEAGKGVERYWSDWYNIERKSLADKGYSLYLYKKAFTRRGKFLGGVPSFD